MWNDERTQPILRGRGGAARRNGATHRDGGVAVDGDVELSIDVRDLMGFEMMPSWSRGSERSEFAVTAALTSPEASALAEDACSVELGETAQGSTLCVRFRAKCQGDRSGAMLANHNVDIATFSIVTSQQMPSLQPTPPCVLGPLAL